MTMDEVTDTTLQLIAETHYHDTMCLRLFASLPLKQRAGAITTLFAQLDRFQRDEVLQRLDFIRNETRILSRELHIGNDHE